MLVKVWGAWKLTVGQKRGEHFRQILPTMWRMRQAPKKRKDDKNIFYDLGIHI